MKKISLLVIITLMVSACSTIQTTSGREYLARNQHVADYSVRTESSSRSDDSVSLKEALVATASIEPTLKFPARIGLARVDYGQISALPFEEVEAWEAVKKNLGTSFGEFIPVSPMVVTMTNSEYGYDNGYNYAANIISSLRLAAAKQHLDALLIYEVHAATETESNILSVANISIIGGYIFPSKEINSEGIANAMLIDVMQGYPYATTEAKVAKSEMSTSWGKSMNEKQLSQKVKITAAIKMTKEVEDMLKQLRWELAEKREKHN